MTSPSSPDHLEPSGPVSPGTSGRSASAAVRAAVLVLALVVGVGLLVRSPATTDAPLDRASGPTTSDSEPVATAVPRPGAIPTGGGAWAAIDARPPVDLLRVSPGVWNGRELIVGFAPAVAAYSPDRSGRDVWRQLPPHPDGALQIRGAVQVRGAQVLVYGQKTCAGCPWEPALHALDPQEGSWARLPDAPGPPAQDGEVVAALGNEMALLRDRGDEGIEALAFDPLTETWRDLEVPPLGRVRWSAVGAGEQLLVLATDDGSGARSRTRALLHDLADDAWVDVADGLPLDRAHEAAAVWTGDSVVLFGASARDGGPRGAALALVDATWTPLPDLPADDPLLPDLSALGALTGIVGTWDGERALFVGGLSAPVHVGWSPDARQWEVRRPTGPRAEPTAAWTGRELLLWSGVDRRGPTADLQVWSPGPPD